MVDIRKFIAFLASLLLLSAASCTVKENREVCPVYVTVLTDRYIQVGQESGMVTFSASTILQRDEINFLDYQGMGYTWPCPKDFARVSVLSGTVNGKFSDGIYFIPPGRSGDRVWAYSESFSVNADEYVIDAIPHKQYCLVKFMFGESPIAPAVYPWRFRIKADCSGMNIYTLEPVEGDYSCPVGPNAVGEWYGVIPRQHENNMKLEIVLPNEDSEFDGRVDYVIDLGRRFADAGYDWTEEDLKDMVVKVGFTELDVSLEIVPWLEDGARNVHI